MRPRVDEPEWIRLLYAGLSDTLVTHRKRAGLSQQDLADRVFMNRTSVANMEAGNQRPAVHVWMILFGELGLRLGDILAPQERVKPRIRVYPLVTEAGNLVM